MARGAPGSTGFLIAASSLPPSDCLNATGARDIEAAEPSVAFGARRLAYSDIPPRFGGGGAAILVRLVAVRIQERFVLIRN